MFEGMEEHFGKGTREGLDSIKDHLKVVSDNKEEGTKLLSNKLDMCGSETLVDSVMLCPGTAPFEWDADINAKLNLGGEQVLMRVCIPKSIMLAFNLKKELYEQNPDKDPMDVHRQTRLMLELIFLKGVASFIHDEEGLRNKLMAHQLMEMMQQMRRSNDDD